MVSTQQSEAKPLRGRRLAAVTNLIYTPPLSSHPVPSPTVPRDWQKVTAYCKRLGVVPNSFEPNMSNAFLSWAPAEQDDAGAEEKQKAIQGYQSEVAQRGAGILGGFEPMLGGARAGVVA